MSLTRLRTFVEVYRQRSISAAARMLDLTQPAVSQHIAALENAIGHPLFERQASGVVPTGAAHDLAVDIGDRLDSAEAALATARARSSQMAGAVRIVGHGDFLADVVAPRLIPLLRDGVQVRLLNGDRDTVPQQLVDGHADLGITAFPQRDRRLRSEAIREEPVLAVASPAVVARIAAAPDPLLAALAEPVVAYDHEWPLIDNWLARAVKARASGPLARPSPAVLGQDLRALRSLLREGYGWSVMPAYLCESHIARGQLAPIPDPLGPMIYTYYLVWSPATMRQPRMAHARQMLLAALREKSFSESM